jgi:hypothetical protein
MPILRVCFFTLAVLSFSSFAGSQWSNPNMLPDLNGLGGKPSAFAYQSVSRVPSGVILIKGAWSSASDSSTPTPEDVKVANDIFEDRYFDLRYALPRGWTEKYQGPPPSDSGRYVLAEFSPAGPTRSLRRGSILITAEDMFFTALPVTNAREFINYTRDHLEQDYKVERAPEQHWMNGRSFWFFAYWSPAAQLHWYVLATEIRCHILQLVLTSRDTELLNELIGQMNGITLPLDVAAGAGTFPVCLGDYARGDNVLAQTDPIFTERRFNPIPVRIIIDKRGRIEYIHFLSAFPDQAKAITDALAQWKFKPYFRNGEPVEVETGLLFGPAPHPGSPPKK